MKLGGGGSAYMQNGREWADRRVSVVGGRGSLALPPYEFLDTRLHGEICLANVVMGDLRTCRLGARNGLKSANWSGVTGQRRP